MIKEKRNVLNRPNIGISNEGSKQREYTRYANSGVDILNHGGDSLRMQIALLFQLLPTKECENVFFYILKENRIFIIDYFSTPSLVVAL